MIETVRLSQRAKEQLITLKRRTGIENWNVLCRWALCLSLAEPTPPQDVEIITDSSIEMSWKVFGGKYADVYESLVVSELVRKRMEVTSEKFSSVIKQHVHRGIRYMDSIHSVKEIFKL